MFNPGEVKEIVNLAIREGWAFQKTFQALKNAGVLRYRTMVSDRETTYIGSNKKYTAPQTGDVSRQQIAESFDSRAVQKAIIRHQEGQTTYDEFLAELADAGVEFYEVYTDTGAVHYTTGNPFESFVQPVTDVWD